MKLGELKENTEAVVSGLSGDSRFIGRITSIGLTPGCRVSVIKNDKNRPLLIYSRDTMIALNRRECEGIFVDVKSLLQNDSSESRKATERNRNGVRL